MDRILINPMNEDIHSEPPAPSRLGDLKGKTIGLLDISKAGGKIFFDRLQYLLQEKSGVTAVVRETKPTFSKVAPKNILDRLLAKKIDAVLVGLAD